MGFDASVLALRVAQAERHLVEADRYEENGDLRFSRQSARHAAHYFESAANEALISNLDHARTLLVLAETNYLRGKSPVYVRKARTRTEAVDVAIKERERANQEWIDSRRPVTTADEARHWEEAQRAYDTH